MHRYFYGLLFAILVLSITGPLEAKRTFGGGGRHSYPKSGGGLSGGGGSHSYPHSGGLSGGGHGYPSSGGTHGYPSSGGLSGGGGGSHAYPSSGGSHGYPSSGGLSGGGGGSHAYPSSGGSHGYPSSGGSHNYPSSGGTHGYPVPYHYSYTPPQQIRYTPVHGSAPVSYPVYRGPPPAYVYQYKDSGSKYGTLLAGLALLNLGTLAAGTYALSNSHSSKYNYTPQQGEYCKFGLKKDNGDYEETKIDCRMISSFIFEEETKAKTGGTNTTVITTVTNVTTVNGPSTESPPGPKTLYEMLPNGTLVPVNMTHEAAANTTSDAANNTMTSSVTITTTNTTVTDAIDVKGKPVEVTPGMQCYLIRHSPTSNMKRSVPCKLLQTYADQSLKKKNSASRTMPALTILSVIVGMLVLH